MPKWNGGVIGVANNPTQNAAKGVWSLSEATKAIRAGLWPPSNAGADPYFENVTLLLPGDGTNGAQNNTFLDSSTNNFTITRNGNTTQGTFSPFSKVDGRWAAFTNGSTQDVLITDNSAFQPGSGDFTYEAWIYPLSLPSAGNYKTFWAQRSSASANGGVCPVVDSSGNLLLFVANSTASSWQLTGASTGITISTNQWQHIAITRSGNTITPYKNGTAGTTSSVSTGAIGTSAGLSLMAGSYDGAQLVDGYMSNFRMVKGTAITPPAGGPTAPLSAVSGTGVLTLQSNRFIDNSGNNQTVTPVGGAQITTFSPFPTMTAYAAGTNGGSGYFDGTGDYLTSSTSLFNYTTGNASTQTFTIEAFVYHVARSTPSAVQYTQSIAAKGDVYLNFGINGTGNLVFYHWDGSAKSFTGSSVIPLNQWTHVAVRVTGGTATLYVNGVSDGSGTWYGIQSAGLTATSYFGTPALNASALAFNGYISNLRVSDNARTISIPTAPYSSDGNTSFLANFTNGGIIDTSMSNDLETVGNAQISTTQSKFGGGSMYFDGTGDYLKGNALTAGLTGSGDFTIEGWVYISSLPGAEVSFCSTCESGGTGIIFGLGGGGNVNKLQLAIGNLSVGNPTVVDSVNFTTGAWVHFAAVRYNGTIYLYKNGTSVGTPTSASGTLDRQTVTIGAFPSGASTLTGYIDDLRISKGLARYTANFTAPASPFNGFGD